MFQDVSALTTGHGAPIADKLNSVTIGPRGPLLIQDHAFLEEMAHFDRWKEYENMICIALGERLFSFESLFNLLVKHLYQGANSREGGPCKRRRSFRLL